MLLVSTELCINMCYDDKIFKKVRRSADIVFGRGMQCEVLALTRVWVTPQKKMRKDCLSLRMV